MVQVASQSTLRSSSVRIDKSRVGESGGIGASYLISARLSRRQAARFHGCSSGRSISQGAVMPDHDGARLIRRTRAQLPERRLRLFDKKIDDVAGPFVAERAKAP